MTDILLISDLAGVGKVALSAMTPILTQKESNLCFLPTAVVSNNFDYGEAIVHDLTQFMDESVEIWAKHQFQFDVMTTGFLMSKRQVEIIERLIKQQEHRPFIISDPIMGDDGSLYPGLSNDLVEGMRAITPFADLMLPNLTEAALIVGEEKAYHNIDEARVKRWIDRLREKGAKSIVITSVELKGEHFIYGYSEKARDYFRVKYRMIPMQFGGTGDIFSALMTAEIVKNRNDTLENMVKRSAETISEILEVEAKRVTEARRMQPALKAEVMVQNYLPQLTASYKRVAQE